MTATETKHTPGTFEVERAGDCPDYHRVYIMAKEAPYSIVRGRWVGIAIGATPTEAKANGALFAAAPDMLKACKAACIELAKLGTTPALGELIAAIAKAEGV